MRIKGTLKIREQDVEKRWNVKKVEVENKNLINWKQNKKTKKKDNEYEWNY